MANEDVTSGGDLAAAYPMLSGNVPRHPNTKLAGDYTDTHGFNLPGKAEDHAAPSGVYSAEKALDRYGGDGDDDGPESDDPSQRDDNPPKRASRASTSDTSDDDEHDYRD